MVQKEVETSDAQLQASTTSLHVGQTLRWIVERIEPLQIHFKPENSNLQDANLSATLHISSVIDHNDGCDDLEDSLKNYSALKKKQKQLEISPLHPFYGIREGQVISGKIINMRKKKGNSNNEEEAAKETTIISLLANLQSKGICYHSLCSITCYLI